MKTENKEKLLTLLEGHKVKEDKLDNLRKENINKRDQFLQSFEQLATTIIRPLMEKYAEEIRPYDHYVHINYSPSDRKMQGGTPACIKMDIYINSNSAKSGNHPYVSFSASEYSQQIGFSYSTMLPGAGGSTDNSNRDIQLSQLTAEFIEQRIMVAISAIFDNK